MKKPYFTKEEKREMRILKPIERKKVYYTVEDFIKGNTLSDGKLSTWAKRILVYNLHKFKGEDFWDALYALEVDWDSIYAKFLAYLYEQGELKRWRDHEIQR